jgi:hypothetical protein
MHYDGLGLGLSIVPADEDEKGADEEEGEEADDERPLEPGVGIGGLLRFDRLGDGKLDFRIGDRPFDFDGFEGIAFFHARSVQEELGARS